MRFSALLRIEIYFPNGQNICRCGVSGMSHPLIKGKSHLSWQNANTHLKRIKQWAWRNRGEVQSRGPEMLRDFFAGLRGYINLSIMLSVKCDQAHSAVSVSWRKSRLILWISGQLRQKSLKIWLRNSNVLSSNLQEDQIRKHRSALRPYKLDSCLVWVARSYNWGSLSWNAWVNLWYVNVDFSDSQHVVLSEPSWPTLHQDAG